MWTCGTVAASRAVVLPIELLTSPRTLTSPKGWQCQPPAFLQKHHPCHQDAPFLRKQLYRWSAAVLLYPRTRLLNNPNTTLAFLHPMKLCSKFSISPVCVSLLKPRNPVSNAQPGPAVVTVDVQWPTFNTAYVAFLAALCLNGRICNKRSIYGSLLLQGSLAIVRSYNDKMLRWVQWGLQKSAPLFM